MLVMEEYLTVEEVAKNLRVSTDTILRLIKARKLVAYKVSGVWRIMPDDLQRYLDAQRNVKKQTE